MTIKEREIVLNSVQNNNGFLFKIINSPIVRLNYINRFNGKPQNRFESVSEHSYWVACFSFLILEYIGLDELSGEEYSLLKSIFLLTLTKSLFHDLDEVFTGDVIFPLKYCFGEDSEQIKEKVNKIGKECIDDLIFKLFADKSHCGINYNSDELNVGGARIFAFIDKIVKLADWLSCYLKSLEEVKQSNVYFDDTLLFSEEKIYFLIRELQIFLDQEGIEFEMLRGIFSKEKLQSLI